MIARSRPTPTRTRGIATHEAQTAHPAAGRYGVDGGLQRRRQHRAGGPVPRAGRPCLARRAQRGRPAGRRQGPERRALSRVLGLPRDVGRRSQPEGERGRHRHHGHRCGRDARGRHRLHRDRIRPRRGDHPDRAGGRQHRARSGERPGPCHSRRAECPGGGHLRHRARRGPRGGNARADRRRVRRCGRLSRGAGG